MATPEFAAAALSLHSHSMDGRNIAVTEARPLEANRGPDGHGFEVYQSPEQKQRRPQRQGPQCGRKQRQTPFSLPINFKSGMSRQR